MWKYSYCLNVSKHYSYVCTRVHTFQLFQMSLTYLKYYVCVCIKLIINKKGVLKENSLEQNEIVEYKTFEL